jgi:hypothetical protein
MAISALDSALEFAASPETTYRFRAPCPEHVQHGDEARLDFSASGWPRSKCAQNHPRSCEPVWRVSIFCEKQLFQECYCDQVLPDHLRRLTREPKAS